MSEPYATLDEVRAWILRKLGGCNVAVELSPQQVDDAIYDSLDKMNQYMSKPVPNVLANQENAVTIPLGENARGVIMVKGLIPRDYRIYGQINIFEILYRMVFPRLPLGDWYMLKSFYEMYLDTRGVDFDWYEDESTKTLYVDCTSGPYDIFYVVAEDLSVDDMPSLKKAYTKMFRDYALAEAKITLGRIRGKYGASIPVPGGTLTTDASSLLQEGEATKLDIEERLDKIARFSISPVTIG